jgi:nicotinamide-nucleotide amidase
LSKVSIEIIAVGNELLNGSIQDTNTHWFCKILTDFGGDVQRAVLLPDDEDVICREIAGALRRETSVIFVSGGLGPTTDDLTLSAVAKGAGVSLQLSEDAREMIRSSYDYFASKGVFSQGGLNPGREKMAWLPEGAIPLENPIGTAPGVLFSHHSSTIICLPGVPGELKSIVETSLKDFIAEIFHAGFFGEKSLVVQCNDESLLDPFFKRFAENYPDLYLKARSGLIEETPQLTLVVSGRSETEVQIEFILSKALDELQIWLSEEGGFRVSEYRS